MGEREIRSEVKENKRQKQPLPSSYSTAAEVITHDQMSQAMRDRITLERLVKILDSPPPSHHTTLLKLQAASSPFTLSALLSSSRVKITDLKASEKVIKRVE